MKRTEEREKQQDGAKDIEGSAGIVSISPRTQVLLPLVGFPLPIQPHLGDHLQELFPGHPRSGIRGHRSAGCCGLFWLQQGGNLPDRDEMALLSGSLPHDVVLRLEFG